MIFALESSCDETAAAGFDPASGLVGEWVHSQMALHGRYGGVVPDLATREHLRTIGPLLGEVGRELNWARVTRVAVTCGPGLAGCLAIGVAAAKALAVDLGVPLVGVNHLRGHAWSPFISLHAETGAGFDAALAERLPQLGLVVSGGNTLLFRMDEAREITGLAATLDDAAGEALDKGAKLLGLGYPGGPLIEQAARGGNAAAFAFPRGIAKRSVWDFSFSGLKTSLRYLIEKMSAEEVTARMGDLCASYQEAVVESLARKARLALAAGWYRSLGLSGGVANNGRLRAVMAEVAAEAGVELRAAEARHTGDNAAMIAFAAWADPATQEGADGVRLMIAPGLPLAASGRAV